jgi:hypothetical protein
MSWPALLVTFGSVFALACSGSPSSSPTDSPSVGPAAAINQPVELAPGQSTQFGALRLTFTGVTGDSRCPVDVTCVWEGDGVAKIELSQPTSDTETRELHTAGPRSTTYGSYQVELVRLDPAPRSTQTIPPASYRLVVRVTQVS